jgi:predicted ABC-type ATPase
MKDAPFLLVIAGPNGSGKTTLTNRLRSLELDFGSYINADEIAARLLTDNKAAAPEASRQAQIEADRLRREMLDRRESYSFETVMSHPSKIEEMLEARSLGYEVVLYFVAVDDPSINVKRVAQRVARGGHDVPVDKIIARYQRTLELLPMAMLAAHRSVIFDNSDLEKGLMRLASAKTEGTDLVLSLEYPRAEIRPWFHRFGLQALEAVSSSYYTRESQQGHTEIVFSRRKGYALP